MLLVLQMAGCPEFNPVPPKPDLSKVDVTHTVARKGETLSLISAWYTGSTENWRAIAEANPKIQVNKIRMGDQIVIPARMVTQRDPMPAKYQPGASASGASKGTGKRSSKVEPTPSSGSPGPDTTDVVPPPSSSGASSSSSVGPTPAGTVPAAASSGVSAGSAGATSSAASSQTSYPAMGADAPGDQMMFVTPVPNVVVTPKGAASSSARPLGDAFDFLEPEDGPAMKAPSKTGLSGAGAGNVAEVRPSSSDATRPAAVASVPATTSTSSAKSAGVKTRDELLEELLN